MGEKLEIKPFGQPIKECLANFKSKVMENPYDVVLVTHKNCIDGAGTATAFGYWINNFPDAVDINYDVIYLDYDDYDTDSIVEKLTDKVVFVGDFSFDMETHRRIEEVTKIYYTVDHHQTPYLSAVADEPNTYFDTSHSGAVLTWNFFENPEEVPKVLLLIEDYDIYKFEFERETRAFQLFSKVSDLNDYTVFARFVPTDIDYENNLEEVIQNNLPAVDVYLAKCLALAKKATPYTVCGESFVGINLTTSVSDVLNKASVLNNLPSFSWRIENNKLCMSFRNADDSFNVGTFAIDNFGGGGHAKASGGKAHIDDIDFNMFIRENILNYKK